MRKLKLSLDSLQVESFDTDASQSMRGTVAGRAVTDYPDECVTPAGTCFKNCSVDATCNSCDYSCAGSCWGTCGASCNGSCGASCGCNTDYTACGCQTFETCPGAPICS